MEGLLTPVSTSYRDTPALSKVDLVESQLPSTTESGSPRKASTPEEALQILQGEPSFSELQSVLRLISEEVPSKTNFNISSPSPLAAQLVNILVTGIVPSYWSLLQEKLDKSKQALFKHRQERILLLKCLRSITGLNAILTQMKAMIKQTKDRPREASLQAITILRDLYSVLEAALNGTNIVQYLWNNIHQESPQKQRGLWHEMVILLTGGRIISIAAESHAVIKGSDGNLDEPLWIGDGTLYARWVVQNIKQWILQLSVGEPDIWKRVSELLSKSLRLGYQDVISYDILELLLGSDDDRLRFESLLSQISSNDQRVFVTVGLRFLSTRYTFSENSYEDLDWWKSDTGLVSAAAGFLKALISDQESRREALILWLTGLSGAGVGAPIGIRRAALCVLSDSRSHLESVLEKSLGQFGDQLYIKHTPILQQEVHTQVILLAAGYVHRTAPLKLSIILRSSLYLNAVSHRLAASSDRARYLGMIVGEALSSLVEKGDKRMTFKMEELESPEAKWYKNLVNVSDEVGPIEMLKAAVPPKVPAKRKSQREAAPPKRSILSGGYSKILAIEEIEDDVNEEDQPEQDDLIPYAKPDSDPEDSDEDPTLIQRNKPTAPVYIRDLIVYLRDTESYDRQKLALTTGPQLIRRKAHFGTEVTEHVEELATLYVGVQDKFDIDNFNDMRLQCMIAVLISQPSKMGKWFARTFFEGDYSVSQRASVLTVLSIGARELGGFKDQDASLTTVKPALQNEFPSKRLPSRLHALYASSQAPDGRAIDALSRQLSNTMLQPLAASAADEVTGPNVLKVRTFSSRLEVESRRKPATVNALSTMVADSFFFPLTGRFFAHLKAYGPKNVIFEPFLLSSFLKTLTLILHASGPSALQLPQMTNEMWDLLLSLRIQAQDDRVVGQALLLGFMTILEINQDARRLAEAHGRELLETQRWVELYFQTLGQGSDEDDRVRALAAGVLYRIKEVVEKYQALLVGELSGV